MNCFEKVGQRLGNWAIRVRDARGESIANITTDTIKNLCGKQYFVLPDKFKSYIDDYRRQEGALQSIADYRDHFIHPFHVFVIGYIILDQMRKKGIKTLNLLGKDDENINLKTWFITSIYHDVGYPADKLEALVSHFFKTSVGREMNSQFDWSSVLLADDNIKHIDALSALFTKKVRNKDEAEIFEQWFHKRLLEEHDHGVLTALMLCNQHWKKEDFDSFVYEAALAIALHSWKGSFRIPSNEFNLSSLALENFPLAFFLSYCDSAQEWGRRVLLELMKKENVPFEVTGLDSRLDDIQVNQKIIVTLKYPTKANELVIKERSLILRQVFHDFGDKFESTWHIKDTLTTNFLIQGMDKHDHSLGSFGPRFTLPTSPNSG